MGRRNGVVQLKTIGSLCTGYGGLDQAAELAFGAKTIWVSDIEPNVCKLIEHNMPGIPNLGDLKEIDWETVTRPNILTAGYPCQPFSQAGNREGVNDPRHIWPYIYKGVCILRPDYIVLENVSGHRSKGFGTVLGDLAEARYDAEWRSIRASDAGAPHRRERVFFLAKNTDR